MRLGLSLFVGSVIGVIGGVVFGMAVERFLPPLDVAWVDVTRLQAIVVAGLGASLLLRWFASSQRTTARVEPGATSERGEASDARD
jgi:hypothetical protein